MIYFLTIGCNENVILGANVKLSDTGSIIDTDTDTDTDIDTDTDTEEISLPQPTELLYIHSATQLYSWSDETGFSGIGNFTLPDGNQPNITDIAINSAGEFYAISTSSLYQVNPDTADLLLMGSLSEPLFGLAFDASDTLYGSGNGLFIVNVTSSSLIPIDLDTSLQNTGDLVGTPDGSLFCFMDNPESAAGDVLLSIAPQSGTTQIIASLEIEEFWGAAYAYNMIIAVSNSGYMLLIDLETGEANAYETEVTDLWGASSNPVFVD